MVKVGINGFGRIGRNVVRAALERKSRHRIRRRQRSHRRGDARVSAQVRLGARHDPERASSTPTNGITIDGKELRVFSTPDPAEIPWSDLGVEIVVESSGRFTSRTKLAPSARRASRRDHLRAVEGRRRHVLHRRERERLRSRRSTRSSRTPRARRTAWRRWPRCCTRSFGIDDGDHDHGPLVHERSGDPRPAAQRPPPRPRRRAVDDPDHHRRREGGRPRAAGAERKVRRHLRARADAERLAGRPDVPHREGDERRGDQPGPARRGERRAERHPRPTPTSSSSRSTSTTTRTRRSSTRPSPARSTRTCTRSWRGTTTSGATRTASSI